MDKKLGRTSLGITGGIAIIITTYSLPASSSSSFPCFIVYRVIVLLFTTTFGQFFFLEMIYIFLNKGNRDNFFFQLLLFTIIIFQYFF